MPASFIVGSNEGPVDSSSTAGAGTSQHCSSQYDGELSSKKRLSPQTQTNPAAESSSPQAATNESVITSAKNDERDNHENLLSKDKENEADSATTASISQMSKQQQQPRRQQQQQPPPPPYGACEDDSYPTPIISNRGVFGNSPSAYDKTILIPLSLPAAAVAEKTTATTKTHIINNNNNTGDESQWGASQQSSTTASIHARFSSPHETPIQCSWPSHPGADMTATTNNAATRVPPEISIPILQLPTDLTASSGTPNSLINFGIIPAVTGGGDYLRLVWQLCRLAAISTGSLPRVFPWWIIFGSSSSSAPSESTFKKPYQRRKLRAVIMQTSSSPPQQQQQQQPRRNAATTSITLSSPSPGDGVVHGLPSFGQTCFLNATLQSLASLEAFGVYLQHVVHLVETERARQENPLMSKTDTTTATWLPPSSSSHTFGSSRKNAGTSNVVSEDVCRLLLDCIHSVNGAVARHSSFIDTRPLLREIGKRHSQFSTMGSEQQDAQELLTALLDSVVSEGEITSSSFMYPNSFVTCLPEPMSAVSLLFEDDDDLMTVVSGSKERCRNNSKAHSSNHSLPGATISLSTFHSQTAGGGATVSSNHSGKESVSSSSDEGNDGVGSHTNHRLHYQDHHHMHNGVRVRPEEKKSEDFEVHIPKVSSEEDLGLPFRQAPPVHHIVGHAHLMMDDPSLSDMSSRERPTPRSTSLEIMRTTTTQLSPSPLTGWMGSSLQCRRCGHVRPIRNAPFGDWSVTPTAVADGTLLNASNGSATRPCRLEECLAEYVRVENVNDVECRSCTLQREREKMMEEIEMNEGAIQGLLAKAQRRAGSSEDSCDALRQELHKYRSELHRLQRIDADDDQPIFIAPESDDNATTPPLMRTSARKCMFLTRLPAILCIHVQRRFYNPVIDRMTKVTQHVVFSEMLDVAPYCAYGGVLGGNWAGSSQSSNHRSASPSSLSGKCIPYRLQAVMEHRGGAFSGHYVCYRMFKGDWYFISDQSVRPVSWRDVQRCQAYMLFYEAAM